jgi:ABC-type hemin transport system ATPase subunit
MTQIDLKPSDIIIAVMGVTGAGKSTFIQQFTEENVGIGDSLLSCKPPPHFPPLPKALTIVKQIHQ